MLAGWTVAAGTWSGGGNLARTAMELGSNILPEAESAGSASAAGKGCLCEGGEVSRLEDHLVSPTIHKERAPFMDDRSGMSIN